MHIRPAETSDAATVAEIYNEAVTTSRVTFDLETRTIDEQRQWLADRSGAFAVLVAVDDSDVVGFASLSPYRDRPGYRTTVEDSIYVAADRRGTGVGSVLVEAIVSTARDHGFHSIIARIVADHEASIRLHASAGFTPVGIEREVGRKFGRWLDVQVMQCML